MSKTQIELPAVTASWRAVKIPVYWNLHRRRHGYVHANKVVFWILHILDLPKSQGSLACACCGNKAYSIIVENYQ